MPDEHGDCAENAQIATRTATAVQNQSVAAEPLESMATA